MIRTLIQLDEDTHRRLRQRAFKQRRSMAAVVRDLVAAGLNDDARGHRPTQLRQFESVGAGRSAQGRAVRVSERHDVALTSAFEE
jgi:plasmid stability protein